MPPRLKRVRDSARQRREAQGRRAERLAAWYLRLKGYRVLEERYKSPVGEIDLIAQRGTTLVFVEVKRRKTIDLAIESITPHQRMRIVRTAAYFMTQKPTLSDCEQRIDALCLAPRRWPVHMHNICPG